MRVQEPSLSVYPEREKLSYVIMPSLADPSGSMLGGERVS